MRIQYACNRNERIIKAINIEMGNLVMLERRRKQLITNAKEKQFDIVLINDPSNLYYYTGFTGGEAIFLLLVETGEGYVITDSRYYEQVEKECPELTLVRMEKRGYCDTVKDVFTKIRKEMQWSFGLSNNSSGKSKSSVSVAIEESMNLSWYLKLLKMCEGYDFQLATEWINACRMVKDSEELNKIRQAEAIGDAAFTHILSLIKPGVSEMDIALELEFFMKKQGATKLSFDTIVASGPNSSMPHAQVTNRKIQCGDFVTMDFGCVYQGYCSDMTRTVAVGQLSKEMKKIYDIVLQANLCAMEGIREGIECNVIDALARDYIAEKGYGAYFGHGLGHGVGLDIHEEPRFSPKCDAITKENMVITDEPGIYLPEQFGVRIEDLIVVKKDGYEKLSMSEKELIIL